jgi:hypothetical protein
MRTIGKWRTKLCLLLVGVALGIMAPASAETYGDPFGFVSVGTNGSDASGSVAAVSDTGNAHGGALAVSGGGSSTSEGDGVGSVGWTDSSTDGGAACISMTGDCFGAWAISVCPLGYCE